MRCFLCKENNFEQIYELETKKILECKNDGVFLARIVKTDKTYGKEYFLNQPNSFNKSYFLSKLRKIQKLTAKSRPSILDIGCGWGDFEEVLEKEKIPYLGIDVNKEAIEICKRKKMNCIQGTLDTVFFSSSGRARFAAHLPSRTKQVFSRPNKFDAIVMFQVIEHLNNPIAILQLAKKLLKPNGLMLITTPNNDSPLRKILGPRWSIYNEPSHYVFFNKSTLQKTLQQTRMKDAEVRTDSWRVLSLNYILNRLKQMYFPNVEFRISNFEFFPLPTDPFGDLEAVAKNA